MTFPIRRHRRLRKTPALRRLVAETSLRADDLITPIFVREGIDSPIEIPSLPGIFQHDINSATAFCKRLVHLGIPGVIIFGVPESKDELGSAAWDPDGIAQIAISEIKSTVGDDLVVMADLCLDEYTSSGHCGVVRSSNDVDNDATLELYAKVAIAQAHAGVDLVGPSGMMDGQVGVIRHALDSDGFSDVGIMAYSAKYASALYGPFRDAVDVTIANGGNRSTYQQDFRNSKESLSEILADVDQGADIVMVKPAMTYLDIVSLASRNVTVPVAAYHVSGEYAMIKAADANGWIDGDAVAIEQLTAIKRAGASMILTYFAPFISEILG
ncbi:MAG: porphobilinogen synthase [Actinomycetota bacterium]|nr:MAG: porphobilinogen synthase [Actinomycetota bacterium]